ncbi:hypothetical protein GCM10027047_14500 [Rhodococcus aerolatus]
MSTDQDDQDDQLASLDPQTSTKPSTVFPDLGAWVEGQLAPSLSMHITGDGRGRVFCPQWWDHDAVVIRLAALWEAWETAKTSRTMSTWWVQHADPHLKVLCDGETGPMRRCSEHRHVPTRTLLTVPTPAGWLDQLKDRGPNFRIVAT